MDLPTLLSIAPAIVVLLLIFLGIALFVEFFYLRKKKNKDLTPKSIPELPKENTGTAHFASSYTALPKKKPVLNKKILVSVIVLGIVSLTGLSVFLATKSPKTTNTKASSTPLVGLHRDISGVSGNNLYAGGELRYIGPNPNPNDPPVAVDYRVDFYQCDSIRVNTCNTFSDSREGVVNVPVDGVTTATFQEGFDMNDECGSYQVDAYFNDGVEEKPAGSKLYKFTVDCNPEPTVAPSGTPQPTVPVEPTPAAGRIGGRVAFYACTDTLPNANTCTNIDPSKGINGRSVSLLQNGNTIATTTTSTQFGSPGYFTFDGVAAGHYLVCTNNPGNAVFHCSNGAQPSTPPFCNELDVVAGQNTTSRFIVLKADPATCSTTTPPPGTTNTPIPSNTPTRTPTPTIIASGTPKPTVTPGPSATPTPGPSATPTPGPSATPTQYVVVNATNTPGADTTVVPTVPSAGNPLPLLAIGIPLILIFLAFLL